MYEVEKSYFLGVAAAGTFTHFLVVLSSSYPALQVVVATILLAFGAVLVVLLLAKAGVIAAVPAVRTKAERITGMRFMGLRLTGCEQLQVLYPG
jgi:hypothetical protein